MGFTTVPLQVVDCYMITFGIDHAYVLQATEHQQSRQEVIFLSTGSKELDGILKGLQRPFS